jgi:hypothetical protein
MTTTVTLGFVTERSNGLGSANAFELRLGTGQQVVDERAERLRRAVLVGVDHHDRRVDRHL